jgi:transcriptional regulator with XRE-family HTH domain
MIQTACKRQGIRQKELARKVGLCETTFIKHMQNPWELSFREITRICRYTNMNKEDREELFQTIYEEAYRNDKI